MSIPPSASGCEGFVPLVVLSVDPPNRGSLVPPPAEPLGAKSTQLMVPVGGKMELHRY